MFGSILNGDVSLGSWHFGCVKGLGGQAVENHQGKESPVSAMISQILAFAQLIFGGHLLFLTLQFLTRGIRSKLKLCLLLVNCIDFLIQ